MKWLSTIKSVDGGSMTIEKMKLDDKGFPQPTGEFETLEADSLVLALGQDVDLVACSNDAPGVVIENGVVKVGPDMMTGPRGRVRRRRHGALGAHRHGRGRPRQEGCALRRRLSRRARPMRRRRSTAAASFDRLNAWYYEDAPATVRPMIEAVRRVENFEEVVGGLDETNALYEARRCLSLRQLLRMRQLLRRLPRQRRHQARPGQAVQVRLRLLQGLRPLRRRMPVRGDRHGGGGDLTNRSDGRRGVRLRRIRRAASRTRSTDRAACSSGRASIFSRS